MLAAATIGLAALRGRGAAADEVPPGAEPEGDASGFTLIQGGRSGRSRRTRPSTSSGSFMERMEQRWRRRKENGGF